MKPLPGKRLVRRQVQAEAPADVSQSWSDDQSDDQTNLAGEEQREELQFSIVPKKFRQPRPVMYSRQPAHSKQLKNSSHSHSKHSNHSNHFNHFNQSKQPARQEQVRRQERQEHQEHQEQPKRLAQPRQSRQQLRPQKQDWLERLRQKPPHIKRWYAFSISASVTLAIFAIWSVTLVNGGNLFGQSNSAGAQQAAVVNSPTFNTPMTDFENGIGGVISGIQADIHQIFANTGSVLGSSTTPDQTVENMPQ